MKKLLLFSGFLAFLMTGCYEDYKTDYEYTAAYFANQYPVRTVIIDQDADLFEIKVGATYGGKYSYDGTSQILDFAIEDTLITNNPEFVDMGIKVMPSSWYTLSNNSTINIKNSNIGFVNVSIIKDSLIKHPEASKITYAIPFKLIASTTDSILASKSFSIVAVKFKNEFDGRYYVKGTDNTLNLDGSIASSSVYSNPALVLNKYIYLNTKEKDVLEVPRIGTNESASNFVYNLKFRPSDGTALLSAVPGTNIIELVGGAQYNYEKKLFINKYNYKYNNIEHMVIDTLFYQNTEIKMESWK